MIILSTIAFLASIALFIKLAINKRKNIKSSLNWKHPIILLVVGFILGVLGGATSSTNTESKQSNEASKSSKEQSNKYVSSTPYNTTEGDSNAASFDADSFRDPNNVGKSIHLTHAKIGRIDKEKGGLWIRATDDASTSMSLAYVQGVYTSRSLNEGDVVDINAVILGKKKSVVDPTDEKYPTIDIKGISKK